MDSTRESDRTILERGQGDGRPTGVLSRDGTTVILFTERSLCRDSQSDDESLESPKEQVVYFRFEAYG